ncbi:DUF3108 domain-containing protein [Thalassotalea profundi]|uniref:DUF3108 domain-containing protein n=1 Tax=Thalassotalea profundi TaxID=2036687 RepID=A0ABQ3J0S6_9GAMM|nr:DUF3108 domain-containing protein [Thalassotalea profundi]GHE97902.1 hypothetical protein GCM10011501_29240 [Thalassotalea profundi]
MLKKLLSLGIFYGLLATTTQAEEAIKTNLVNPIIEPFTANYTIIHKSKPVGTAIRELKKLDNGQYEYSYHTDIEWLIFSDVRTETSILEIDNGHVTPFAFKYTREGTGRDKSSHWQFDIKNSTATDIEEKRTYTVEYPVNVQDTLSYHLQHRFNLIMNPEQKNFVYPVVKNEDRIKNYVYQYDGEEKVMLPYGLVKTIKLKREVIEKKRVTYAWFAPELNYLMVKLYQTKGGVEQFEAQLNTVTKK